MTYDLTKWPDSELYRVVGILTCERMLYARPPGTEAIIDAKIAELNEEIAARKRAASPPALADRALRGVAC